MMENAARLLEQVQRAYSASPNPRLNEVMPVLVRHLHELVREIRLSRAEWEFVIAFLTEVGKTCTETRQEFVLLSDTLGVSSLMEILDQPGDGDATPGTVLGPFWVPSAPERELGADLNLWGDADGGRPLRVSGVVRSGRDQSPIAGAEVDVWETASNGFYDVQQPGIQPKWNLRGRFRTDEHGRYWFRTVRPVPYPIPDDGPVGVMLRACQLHGMRAAHVHLMVSAPGHRRVVTHVFDAESDYLDDDAVFGVVPGLSVRMETGESGELECTFDVALAPTDAADTGERAP